MPTHLAHAARFTRSIPSLLLALAACADPATPRALKDPPVASIVTPEPGSAHLRGQNLELQGTVYDAQDPPENLLTTWFVDGVAACPDSSPPVDPGATRGTVLCNARLQTDGSVRVRLSVTDSDGMSGESELLISVDRGQAPTLTLLAPVADQVVRAGQPFQVQAEVQDAEDDPDLLRVDLRSDVEGALLDGLEPASSGAVGTTLTLQTLGSQLLTTVVTDSTGLTDVAQVLIDVRPANVDPTCEITAPLDGEAFVLGSNVSLLGAVADDDGDPLTATWTFLGAAHPAAVANGEARLTTDALTAGPHDLTLTVTDPAGGTCTDTVTIDIGQAPGLVIVAPADGRTVAFGSAVVLQAQVTDGDDGNPQGLEVVWDSNLQGRLQLPPVLADGTGNAATATSDLQRGQHHLTATVTSQLGITASDTVLLDVNGPPEPPVVAIDPTAPTSADDFTVRVLSSPAERDLDGDTVTYALVWTVDGLPAGTDATISADRTARGQTWSAEVTPVDEHGLEGPTAWVSTLIGDSLPAVSGVAISPTTPRTDDLLTCLHAAPTDADGDDIDLHLSWQADGVEVGLGTTLPAQATSRGQSVTCTVLPDGPWGAGTAVVSPPVLIANTPPTITSAWIEPGAPLPHEDVLCRLGTLGDADGDAVVVTYTWTVDGVVVPGQSGATLPASYTERGDVVACTAVPADGIDSGIPAAAPAVTIANTPPIASVPVLLPADPDTTDDLSCSLPGGALDADGDVPSLSWSWRVDGLLVPETGPVLPASFTERGDQVTCTVQPHDGVEAGEEVSSEAVEVLNALPTATTVAIEPDAPTRADTLIAWTAGFADADGDPEAWHYSWRIDGVEVGTDAFLPGFTAHRGEIVQVIAWPFDGIERGMPLTASTAAFDNALPTAPGVSLAPASPAEGLDDIVCSVDTASFDADGDGITYRFAWTVHSTPFSGAVDGDHPGDTIPATEVRRDQTWVCEVVAYDGLAFSASASASVQTACVPGPLACDEVDDDCDGVLADGFEDRDDDHRPDCVDDDDGDGWPAEQDCDDDDLDAYPGAPEVPDDGVDQDCNGDDTITCHVDQDLDGAGAICTAPDASPDTSTDSALDTGGDPISPCLVLADDGACDDPGEATDATDCDDDSTDVGPAVAEVCNGVDDDCDGETDEQLFAPDADRTDGACTGALKVCAGVAGWVEPDYAALPGYEAQEVSCDGVDNDCDGLDDDGLIAASATEQRGVCAGSRLVCAGEAGWMEPGASDIAHFEWTEASCDGRDNDCDGQTDEALAPPLSSNQRGVCANSQKVCGGASGWLDPNWSGIAHYEANETSCDGRDNDCDNAVDDNLSPPLSSRQSGVCSGSRKTCGGGSGWLDPNWTSIAWFESSETSCDGRDNDCDNAVDEMKRTRWRDADEDGAGNPGVSAHVCPTDPAYVDNNDDCDDTQDWIAPGLDMMQLLSMWHPTRRDHLTTSSEAGGVGDQVTARSLGYGNDVPYVIGWSVRGFPPGYTRGTEWVELDRPFSPTTFDHITITTNGSVSGHDHNGVNPGLNPTGLKLGWVRASDLGDYTRKFERFFKAADQDHAMSADTNHENTLLSQGFSRDGNAGYSFTEDHSCP
jgi:hypothetical protein